MMNPDLLRKIKSEVYGSSEGKFARERYLAEGFDEFKLPSVNALCHSEVQVTTQIERYLQLKLELPLNVVIDESLNHSVDRPYWECSLFAPKRDRKQIELKLAAAGVRIEVFHPAQDNP